MTNDKLIQRLVKRGIFLNYTNDEMCKGLSVPQNQHHHKNMEYIAKNQAQIRSITKTEWNTATNK